MNSSFCVFVLSHGRPDNVVTMKTLKKQGYTGKIIVVIDNEDPCADEYMEKFDDVEVIDKKEIAKTFDTADLSEDRRTVVYARNACFEIARRRGYECFLELDDDYSSFEHREVKDAKLLVSKFDNLDELFAAMVRFLYKTDAIAVAFAQGGDFIGGKASKNYKSGLLRKAMNTFFCRVDKPFKFVGRVNEDVNTYVTLGMRGELMLTVCDASITQGRTQGHKGGMTECYLNNGTYVKSFYTVMMAPSCVRIGLMGDKHTRIHHRVKWDNAVPKILSEKWRHA